MARVQAAVSAGASTSTGVASICWDIWRRFWLILDLARNVLLAPESLQIP